MARTSKAELSAVATAATEAQLPADFPDLLDSGSLALLREALSIDDETETTVHVYRVNPETKMDAKIWDGDADAFNLAGLAKVFGSGQYRVKVYVRNPDGYKPLRYNRIQEWELSPEDESRVSAARWAAKNPSAVPPPKADVNTGEIIERMMLGFQQTVGQMLTALQPAAQPNPMEQMKQLAEVMRIMAPPPQSATVAPDPFTQLTGMLGMMEKLKTITKSDIPDGASASETLMLRAAEAFMPALANGLTKAPAPVNGAQPAPAALPAPAPSPTSDQPALTEEQELMKATEALKLMKFKAALVVANKNAARGVPAAEYAEEIYDLFDEEDIVNIATEPQWFEIMVQVAPGCAAHREWYAALRARLIALALEDGLLEQGADGALTAAGEAGITGSTSTGESLGTSGADSGTAAK